MSLFEEYAAKFGNPKKKDMSQVLEEVKTKCFELIKEGKTLPYKVRIRDTQHIDPQELEIFLCNNDIIVNCIEYIPFEGDKELHIVVKEFTQPKKNLEVKQVNPIVKPKKHTPSFKKWWFNDGFNNWGY